jgi:hypothetical protein
MAEYFQHYNMIDLESIGFHASGSDHEQGRSLEIQADDIKECLTAKQNQISRDD